MMNAQTEESLDVINEDNQLTGRALSRRQIHAEGLWHRTVHIYLFRRAAGSIEFLLHLRSKLKESAPGLWDTRFGGHIKAGMTVEEGVRDELHDEIGLDATKLSLMEGEWLKRDFPPNREYTRVYFLEYTDDTNKLRFNDGEVDEVKWMSVDDIQASMQKNPEIWSASLDGFIDISNYLSQKIS